jgi:hypothetical protein
MMESLLNELVDTYRLLLNNESLRKAESTNKIPAQVLEDIARCQARIFELYGEMATGKLSTPASIVIRLVCRIAISLHNRYGQYDKYCRFHRKSGCTVCPYVFPTELYVKKFDSIVKPECWDLTAAVENTEKLLVKMSKLLEENGMC